MPQSSHACPAEEDKEVSKKAAIMAYIYLKAYPDNMPSAWCSVLLVVLSE
jgi:hypothetical protein